MNCSKFLGILLIYILIAGPVSAFEIEQLWEVAPPAGQNYRHANIVWSSGDSLPHVFFLDRQDWTVYHMTPGQEFEALCTLPAYVSRFGVCMDSTLESSVLVHYRRIDDSYGRVTFLNLVSGDSLCGIDVTLYYWLAYWGYEEEWSWEPGALTCSGSRNGMIAYLYGDYQRYYDAYGMGWWSRGASYRALCKMWSAREFQEQDERYMARYQTLAFCLMGSDSALDWGCSGRVWGWYESSDLGRWDYNESFTSIAFHCEGYSLTFAEDIGTVMALERADGPAWGLLFSWNDSLKYWVRGPTEVWSIPSSIPSPELAAAFPRRILPQRVALVYSASGLLTEIDLAGGHILESVEFPVNVRALQPYLAADSSWELMAVFDRYVRGYRVTGLLPADDISAASLPESYSLAAYPNPFNDAVTIVYELPRTVEVNLRIVDILGREVTTLANNRQIAGKHEVTWNAANLSSGIYFVHLEVGAATRVQKLVHLK